MKSIILREYKITFERVQPGDNAVDADKDGLKSKLGGLPNWIHRDETPTCPDCYKPMAFIAQIDSIEYDVDYNPHRFHYLSNDMHFMFGDVGMIYVFYCLKCSATKSVFQCY